MSVGQRSQGFFVILLLSWFRARVRGLVCARPLTWFVCRPPAAQIPSGFSVFGLTDCDTLCIYSADQSSLLLKLMQSERLQTVIGLILNLICWSCNCFFFCISCLKVSLYWFAFSIISLDLPPLQWSLFSCCVFINCVVSITSQCWLDECCSLNNIRLLSCCVVKWGWTFILKEVLFIVNLTKCDRKSCPSRLSCSVCDAASVCISQSWMLQRDRCSR